jgi:hypothetical protein
MELKKAAEKTVNILVSSIEKGLEEEFEDKLGKKVKEIILEDYDFQLNGVANPRSKIAPERLMSEFTDRLEDFEFVKKIDDGIEITTPNMENFPFYGRLRPLENILEGLAGKYVEIEGRDYRRASGRLTYRGKHIRTDVTYLFKYNSEVVEWEKALSKKFELYPFSNTPPIDIFSNADKFIEDNLDEFIDCVLEESEKKLPKTI